MHDFILNVYGVIAYFFFPGQPIAVVSLTIQQRAAENLYLGKS